ncbi:hypothetical protein NUW54_g10990 [Trametes sanguinea]|uniref:Uncharacterized protein n=1 Tax=Trametes sanguinea TaxID=158606 RepID=A0ACC1NMQ1_9APHY|nr:hypothetical protein NUW54_g10990 [Trametes sanguinea]
MSDFLYNISTFVLVAILHFAFIAFFFWFCRKLMQYDHWAVQRMDDERTTRHAGSKVWRDRYVTTSFPSICDD